jgi:hypothetical protein
MVLRQKALRRPRQLPASTQNYEHDDNCNRD